MSSGGTGDIEHREAGLSPEFHNRDLGGFQQTEGDDFPALVLIDKDITRLEQERKYSPPPGVECRKVFHGGNFPHEGRMINRNLASY